MIRCPKCETLNRDGSRFCNECGTQLQRTTNVRCSACGASNPVGNIFCDKCHNRLVPLEGVVPQTKKPPEARVVEETATNLKGLSLPTRPGATPSSAQPDDMPDWLRGLDNTTPAVPVSESPEPAEDLPDWLRRLDAPEAPAAPEASPAEDLPDWMRGLQEPATPEASPTEDLPDWLRGLDAPTTPAAVETSPAEDLPDWMRDLQEPATPATPEASPAEDLPDWMRGLQEPATPAAVETSPAEDLPDWLRGLDAPTTPAAVEASPAEDLPDWMRGLQEPTTPAAVETSPAGDLPDWMQGLQEPEPATPVAVSGTYPDWLGRVGKLLPHSSSGGGLTEPPEWLNRVGRPLAASGTATGSVAAPDWLYNVGQLLEEREAVSSSQVPLGNSTAEMAEDLPDWMKGLADMPAPASVTEVPAASEPAEELPDWLRGLDAPGASAPAAPAPAAASEPAEELPDWLRGLDAPGVSAPAASAPAAASEPAEELPDWLRGLDAPGASAPAAPAPAAASEPAEELPDWLRGLDAPGVSAPAAPAPAAASEPAEELPDWLRGLDAPGASAPAAPAPAAASEPAEELPDWLRGLDAPGASAPAAPAPDEAPDWLRGVADQPPAPASGTPAAFSEMPDWLSGEVGGGAAGAAAPADDMPDWLKGMTPTADSGAAAESEVPEWLSGLAPSGSAGAESPAVFVESDSEPAGAGSPKKGAGQPAGRPRKTAESEVPEWLREAQSQAGKPSASEPSAVSGEVPGWLKELQPSGEKAPAFPPSAPLPTNLSQGDVPDWVRQLRPAEAGAAPMPFNIDIPEGAGDSGLERASIPEWIQGLRPTQASAALDDDTTLLERVALRRTEDEGPLVGISGVLSAEPMVDVPANWRSTGSPNPPQAILDHAELWRFLLEQPRGAERPVARPRIRPRWNEAIVRWVMFVVLLAVVGIAFSLTAPGAAHPMVAWARQPGVELLWKRVESLQPGDLVIVAVEYGAADAEEMNRVAAPVLGHLRDRQVRVLAVSSLPEGRAMANTALAMAGFPITATDAISGGNWLDPAVFPGGTAMNRGYLPGDVNGIAWFMAHDPAPRDAKLLIILAARPNRIRWWIEQNANMSLGTLGGADNSQPLPFGAGMSASAFPLVAPYMDLRGREFQGAVGWLAGFSGTWDYMRQRNLPVSGDLETLPARLNALTLSHWVASGLLMLGGAYYLVNYLMKGKKGAS